MMEVLAAEEEDVVAFEDEVEEEVDKALTDQLWNVTMLQFPWIRTLPI